MVPGVRRPSVTRTLALLALVAALLVTGCVGGDVPASNGSNGPGDSVAGSKTTMKPLSDAAAKSRAFGAEKRYIRSRLENETCLANLETFGASTAPNASIVNRSDAGVYVRVQQPYSFVTKASDGDNSTNSTAASHGGTSEYADVYSTALYFVTPNSIRRVRGDPVSHPCDSF